MLCSVFTTFAMMYTSFSTLILTLPSIVAASASLDISSVLSGLGPAPSSDPRWTNYQPPGQGDGMVSMDCRLAQTADSLSALAMPGSQHIGKPRICMLMRCRIVQPKNTDHRLNPDTPQWQEHDNPAPHRRPRGRDEVRLVANNHRDPGHHETGQALLW